MVAKCLEKVRKVFEDPKRVRIFISCQEIAIKSRKGVKSFSLLGCQLLLNGQDTTHACFHVACLLCFTNGFGISLFWLGHTTTYATCTGDSVYFVDCSTGRVMKNISNLEKHFTV